MTYWQLISTGDPVQTGDPVGSDRITTSPARAGTGETGNGPVTCLTREPVRKGDPFLEVEFFFRTRILVRET